MIISIARQCGCGAFQVGQLLSEFYHIPVYTRLSLQNLARSRGVLSQFDNFFEERPADELMLALSSEMDSPALLSDKTFQLLSQLIGVQDCIIIGRCGNYIFRDRKDLISVFLKGDLPLRVQAIASNRNWNDAQAQDFVSEMDNSRMRYHQYYTGLTWGNAADYDLCFDSLRLGAEASARLIRQYIGDVLK